MRQFLSFLWLCLKRSARGNVAQANDWQWVIANPLWQSIGTATGGLLGGYIAKIWQAAPAISPDTVLGVLLGGLFGFVITWLLAFFVRLLGMPSRLYFEQKARADAAEERLSQKLEVTYDQENQRCRDVVTYSGGQPSECGHCIAAIVGWLSVMSDNAANRIERGLKPDPFPTPR